MPYSPPPGAPLQLDFTGAYTPPGAGDLNVEFEQVSADIRAVGGFGAPQAGNPSVRNRSRWVVASGVESQKFGATVVDTDTPRIAPVGIASQAAVGTPEHVSWRQFVQPPSLPRQTSYIAVTRVSLLGGYNAPPGGSVALDWQAGAYAPPYAINLTLEFGALGSGRINGVTLADQVAFGQTLVEQPVGIRPEPASTGAVFGLASVFGANQSIQLAERGIASATFGTAAVTLAAFQALPEGFNAGQVGSLVIWNWLQKLPLSGFNAGRYGDAYIQGGVKYVDLTANRGIAPPAVPEPRLNRYTQELKVPGVEPVALPKPLVRPYIIHPEGIYGTRFNEPLVQFPPRPTGWLSTAFGYPVVEYKTKIVAIGGILSYETGAASIRDKAKKVLHDSSLSTTSVFGDILIRLKNARVWPDGFDAFEPTPWAEVRSNLRFIEAGGRDQLSLGDHEARNATPQVWPDGILATVFGSQTDVGHRERVVYPQGVIAPFPQVPEPVLLQTPSFAPLPIQSPVFPEPNVWFRVRSAQMDGFDTQKVTEPTVWFRWRKVEHETHGADTLKMGDPSVASSLRSLATLGSGFMAFGTAWASYGLRFIDLLEKGIEYPGMSNHQVGYTLEIAPFGFEATGWLRTILPEQQDIYPKAIKGEVGWPLVEFLHREVPVESIKTYPEEHMHWGFTTVWNLRQIVTVEHEDENTGLHPPQGWSAWTLIENRNKTIGTLGENAARFGYTQVDLKARAVLPQSIAAPALPEWQKTGMVSYRVRHLPLEGLEPPYMSGWSVVWNKADPLYPPGTVATIFGTASLVNTRRFLKALGTETREHGFPMVAYRIREIGFDPRYTIASPRIELPTVFNSDSYIEPPGLVEPQASVLHILESKFNRITPKWTQQYDLFGSPILRNLTPELGTRGRAADEWGDALVRLQWRPVEPEGRSTQLFGLTKIADRKQRIEVPGRNLMVVSDKVTVRRDGVDPVVTQYIDLRVFIQDGTGPQQESNEGYGIKIPEYQVSVPDLLKGYIFQKFPYVGGELGFFGDHKITANTIRVEPGYWDFQFPEPFVSLKNRVVEVKTLGQLVEDGGTEASAADMGGWGRPQISPHTIYAVLEAPQQAIRNHLMNPTLLKPVNDGIKVGAPRVSQYLGFVSPLGVPTVGPTWGVGRPTMVAMRQYVQANGLNALRFGWLVIPGPQQIDVEEGIESEFAAGAHKVSHPPPPPQAAPMGFSTAIFGRPVVDFYHRALRANGWVSEGMGTSQSLPGDNLPPQQNPYNMPNKLHVGPPNLHQQIGFDAGGYGDAWVSHWVREVLTKGHDSFVSTYDVEHFEQRMRVKNVDDGLPPRRMVLPVGHDSCHVSAPSTRMGRHYIRPDGNAEQYRKGAPTS